MCTEKNVLVVISKSEAETEQMAANLARALPPGSVLALRGDLGAGKTVFARGFARGLAVDEIISSPTYTIMQEYALPGGKGMFYHMDLYRISDARAALAFGVDEYLDDEDSFVLLEWPERIEELLPEKTIEIQIEHLSDTERKFTLRGPCAALLR
ncbi:MAG: tRNA (adenosine(37)-N6)-threonylcarbamoyltransferase complex ATPase subunit type 1 TsaE [Victivallaceae bacterium]|nr:tRNA (adenosine(37)-N6)-threonylcarbamoyltransferase complex ATPase subunit type 1 TsaE [Victivallaceae bacterium]